MTITSLDKGVARLAILRPPPSDSQTPAKEFGSAWRRLLEAGYSLAEVAEMRDAKVV